MKEQSSLLPIVCLPYILVIKCSEHLKSAAVHLLVINVTYSGVVNQIQEANVIIKLFATIIVTVYINIMVRSYPRLYGKYQTVNSTVQALLQFNW